MQHTWMTVFGIVFIFFMTSLGSAVVYCFKEKVAPRTNLLFLGFSAGIMAAASIWSLLLPALDGAIERLEKYNVFIVCFGFLCGCAFLRATDAFLTHFCQNDGGMVEMNCAKAIKLFLAVTLHNIPEGLAVGFAFGLATAVGDVAFVAALALAIGIGIQNLPEGAAVALPLKTAFGNKNKAFLYGVGSGAVEPIFAAIGYFLAAQLQWLQPWFLSFSAGAMIFVVIDELVPELKTSERSSVGTWAFVLGFILMMSLDVVLG